MQRMDRDLHVQTAQENVIGAQLGIILPTQELWSVMHALLDIILMVRRVELVSG